MRPHKNQVSAVQKYWENWILFQKRSKTHFIRRLLLNNMKENDNVYLCRVWMQYLLKQCCKSKVCFTVQSGTHACIFHPILVDDFYELAYPQGKVVYGPAFALEWRKGLKTQRFMYYIMFDLSVDVLILPIEIVNGSIDSSYFSKSTTL